ncbi:MAG: hypothetical protein DRN83_01685 [Hadesarchaea archaeon]|nr:MAG: hypothetical protein DRN83_01685 [Hadesarchaea archaeon]HDI12609.1 DUF350 domain-containing protein [Hadesarchaea archaeon]
MALGPALGLWELVAFWVAKSLFYMMVCFFLGWIGLRVLDALTPQIHERTLIGKDPRAVGLFVSGFMIYLGLVVYGALTMPTAVGTPILNSIVDVQRLGLLAVAFAVSLLVGVGMFNLLNRLTPRIPFQSLRKSPLGTGFYIFGYFIFLGLITVAALTTPI